MLSAAKRLVKAVRFYPDHPGFQDGSRLFFVTGRSKSGTTWMARLLNCHPALFCDSDENNAVHMDCDIRFFADYPHLVHDKAAEFFTTRTRDLIKNGLIANLIAHCDKLFVRKLGDKTPRQDVARILELWPETRVVVMVRDFRDVLVSLAFHAHRNSGQWEGNFEGPELEALDNGFVRDHLQVFENHQDYAVQTQLATEHPDRVMVVRFEELKQDATATLTRVLRFLGVSDSSMLVQRSIGKNSFEKAAKGRKPGETDPKSFLRKGIVGDWQNHFSEENIRIFKEVAGQTLIAAGYEENNDWGTNAP